MKVTLLTYCTPQYLKSAKGLIKSARKFGLRDIAFYQRSDLEKTLFYQEYKHILDLPQRAGCTLWKIYYIHHEYFKLKEGDILFYADAGSRFIADPKPLIDLCNAKDVVLFNINNSPLNKDWTKRDTFVYMNCDTSYYWESPQYLGAFQLYKRTKKNDEFLNELLHFGKDYRVISDLPNESNFKNFDSFKEHRYDQSVLSIAAAKYNIEAHRYPAQWGNHMKPQKYRVKGEWLAEPYWEKPLTNSDYPTIFDHHRNRNKFKDFIKKINYLYIKHHIKMTLIACKLYKQ